MYRLQDLTLILYFNAHKLMEHFNQLTGDVFLDYT